MTQNEHDEQNHGAGLIHPAIPDVDGTEPRPNTAIQLPDDVSEKMAENAAFVAQRRQADKLRAVADWFTDCKNLNLEQLPVGLIAALRAGADALTDVSLMRDLAKSWRLTSEAHGNQAYVICAQELVDLIGSATVSASAEPSDATRRSAAQDASSHIRQASTPSRGQ